MIQTFVNSVDPTFLTDKILQYAEEPHTQAETIRYLIEKIVEIVKFTVAILKWINEGGGDNGRS